MTIWKLKSGCDRRLRKGHPWVFSNELQHSPKGVKPGALVEVQDVRGNFLARGYGNPQSLISFRALSWNEEDKNPLDIFYLCSALVASYQRRRLCGLSNSFRLCYSEVDNMPGLIIDYYRLSGDQGQVFAIQVLTAGMSEALVRLDEFIKLFLEQVQDEFLYDWDKTAIVKRNDVQIRSLEGLEVEAPAYIHQPFKMDLTSVLIDIDAITVGQKLELKVDLLNGQKTGFFLDQSANISCLGAHLKKTWLHKNKNEVIRIVDLCCHLGQWAAQISFLAKDLGFKVEALLVDASEEALKIAKENVEAQGAQVEVLKADILEDFKYEAGRSQFVLHASTGKEIKDFDIVVCDPPAFIKNKKHLPTGQHAYLKLNTFAFAMAKSAGLVVSCSCSGLLTEDDFSQILEKSLRRSLKQGYVLARGQHAADHPVRLQFPEGRYLKMWLHLVM